MRPPPSPPPTLLPPNQDGNLDTLVELLLAIARRILAEDSVLQSEQQQAA